MVPPLVQFTNLYPEFGDAVRVTVTPSLYVPPPLTVPIAALLDVAVTVYVVVGVSPEHR